MASRSRPVAAAVVLCLVACAPPRSHGSTASVRSPQPSSPSSSIPGGRPPNEGPAPVTVPAATPPADVVGVVEAQRGGRSVALYWRHLLLHGSATDAYLYINDPAKSDLDPTLRARAVDTALAALNLTETWRAGQPRPELPNFTSVAEELTTRSDGTASVEVLAANAARSVEGPDLIDVVIVYRPIYTDGSTDRTNRLVVVMDASFKVTNAYYF